MRDLPHHLLLALTVVSFTLTAHAVERPPAALFEAPPQAAASEVPVALESIEPTGPGAGRVVRAADHIQVPMGQMPALLLVPIPDLGGAPPLLQLTATHDGGHMMAFRIVRDLARQPETDPAPWNPMPIQADGEPHTYDLPLANAQGGAPATPGSMVQIHVAPQPTEVTVHAAIFTTGSYVQGGTLNLMGETHQVLRRLDLAWEVVPGESAKLAAYVGVLPGQNGRLTFACAVSPGEGQAFTPLVRREVDAAQAAGRWQLVTAGLGSGPCRLRFSVEAEGGADAARGFWGSPLVYNQRPASKRRPVILISNDTLRGDHLSCYGYHRNTTPNMDAFAAESVLFENAVSEEPGTLQAHMTMLTGLHPRNHGLTMRPRQQHGAAQVLADDVVTLAQSLAENGYVTAGFVGVGHILAPERGYGRGFDTYSTPDAFRTILQTRETLDPWVRAHADAPFFLFFHHYDIHSKVDGSTRLPYAPVREEDFLWSKEFDPAPPLTRPGKDLPASAFIMAANGGQITPPTKREREYLVALYDDGIRSADRVVGEFLQMLKDLGIYDEALIIITADHGEGFGEHGLYAHSSIYETCAHIPFLLRFPGGEHGGTRVKDVIQLADIMPTVLEFVGIEATGERDGASLYARIAGEPLEKDTVDLLLGNWTGVRSTEEKLVHNETNGKVEFFDLSKDPGETNDLFEASPPQLAKLIAELDIDSRPARGGWHIRFERGPGAGAVAVDINATSPAGLAAHAVRMGEPADRMMRPQQGDRVGGVMSLLANDLDEAVIEPGKPEGALQVHLQSEAPFVLRLGDETVETNTWDGALSASEYRSEAPPASTLPDNAPVHVRMWYDLRPPEALGGVKLTPEQEEHLRALGYVD